MPRTMSQPLEKHPEVLEQLSVSTDDAQDGVVLNWADSYVALDRNYFKWIGNEFILFSFIYLIFIPPLLLCKWHF